MKYNKVIGTNEIKPATLGIFFDDLAAPIGSCRTYYEHM